MKYALFGSPDFAARLVKLLAHGGLPPALLVANPSRPAGRTRALTPPPAKLAAEELGIPVIQPETLAPEIFAGYGPFDCFVVAAYAKILRRDVILLPRRGTVGVHPSLLPKYRGATPIQSAILAGERETGVTLYLMDEKVDHGPILARGKWPVAQSDYEKLERELADVAGELLLAALPDFYSGKILPSPQDESRATFTKKFSSADAFIEERDLAAAESGDAARAAEIERKIRALNPEPGAWTLRGGKRVKLLAAEISGAKLILTKIQEAGKLPRKP